MRSKLAARFAALVGLVGVELFVLLLGTTTAYVSGLSNVSPDPVSSNPNGTHVFFLRVARTAGIQRDVKLAAYYKDDPSGSFIKIYPGSSLNDEDVCNISSQLDEYERSKYLSVTLKDERSGNERIYYISREKACDLKSGGDGENSRGADAANAFYGRYQIPNFGTDEATAKDPATGRYKLNITIALNDGLKPPSVSEAFRQRFLVRTIAYGGSDEPTVAPRGGAGRNFSIVTDWDKRDDAPRDRSIVIPFGLPCTTASAAGIDWRVGVYDADNGFSGGFAPLKVSFQVQYRNDDTNGKWVDAGLSSPSSSLSGSPGTISGQPGVGNGDIASGNFATYVVPDGQSEDVGKATAKVQTVKIDTKYRLVVFHVASRNTIDIVVPEDSIFGDISCDVDKWEMAPTSSVFPSQQQPGRSVVFMHTNKNIKPATSPALDFTAFWYPSNARVRTTDPATINPSNPIASATYKEDQSRSIQVNYTIPTTATAGSRYCQYAVSSLWKTGSTVSIQSPRACVTVAPFPSPPTDRVNITPRVPDVAATIEPTEQATINGSVDVSNFPRPEDGGWGYKELSSQLDANRVVPTEDNDGIESQDSTVYTCPSGYSPTNPSTNTSTSCSKATTGPTTYYCPHGVDTERTSDCKHAYNGTGNDTKTECEGHGYTWGASGCFGTHSKSSTPGSPSIAYASPSSSTQTRYRCADPSQGSWGAYGAAAPTNCKKLYSCPGGARITGTTSSSGWYSTKPTCDGWLCRYLSPQINQSSQPTCEFRCSGGIGDRAYLDRDNGDGSDRRCFVQPTFTMQCRWNDGSITPVTVTFGTSNYCAGSKTVTGQTIGTPVCASLTFAVGGWAGSVEPGWIIDAFGVKRQIRVWGWSDPTTDEGCAKVVAKPTVKVVGGDVVAGVAITGTDGRCSPVSTGSVVGWPHSPDYNASNGQFGVFAPSNVTGFASGAISEQFKPSGLTFANSSPSPSGQNLGGNFGRMNYCVPNHYGDPSSLTSMPLASIGGSSTNGSYKANGSPSSTGSRTIGTKTIPAGNRTAFYVDGDVFINGNITYQGRGGWTTVENIPAFKLVVRGNIYIASNVTTLDGMYIAQPNGSTGGNIYTCAPSRSTLYPTSSLFSNCGTQLTVNGVFIAKKIYLYRTAGTAIFGQTAEQFNYLPELWIANWPTTSTSSVNQLKYDSILSLPPVL